MTNVNNDESMIGKINLFPNSVNGVSLYFKYCVEATRMDKIIANPV